MFSDMFFTIFILFLFLNDFFFGHSNSVAFFREMCYLILFWPYFSSNLNWCYFFLYRSLFWVILTSWALFSVWHCYSMIMFSDLSFFFIFSFFRFSPCISILFCVCYLNSLGFVQFCYLPPRTEPSNSKRALSKSE